VFDHIFAPQVVAVTVDQGVVEIKYRQCHGVIPYARLLVSECLCQNVRLRF
jgi:hypothetical protein